MRSAVLALVLLLFGSATFASTLRLAFYADRNATSCELTAVNPGLLEVQVVLEGSGLVHTVVFKALKPACMRSAVYVADAWDFAGGIAQGPGTTQGSSGAFVLVGCKAAPVYIGRIMYLISEPTAQCCAYEPASAGDYFPDAITVSILDRCTAPPGEPINLSFEPATSKGLIMNSDVTCRCDLPLAVQPTTWGAVKALYR